MNDCRWRAAPADGATSYRPLPHRARHQPHAASPPARAGAVPRQLWARDRRTEGRAPADGIRGGGSLCELAAKPRDRCRSASTCGAACDGQRTAPRHWPPQEVSLGSEGARMRSRSHGVARATCGMRRSRFAVTCSMGPGVHMSHAEQAPGCPRCEAGGWGVSACHRTHGSRHRNAMVKQE